MDQAIEHAGDIDVETLFNEDNLNDAALAGGILSENGIPDGEDANFGHGPIQTEYQANLAVSGPLNRIAWGKSGIVARVVDSGTAVEVTAQRFDNETAAWTNLTPKRLEATFDDVVGLAWSSTGLDLAVAERRLGIHIVNVSPSALNRHVHGLHSLADTDTDTESNQPIGLLWLNLTRGERDKKKTVLENVKENGRWRHEHVEGAPFPPHILRGLCGVTRSGRFFMLFTRDASPYKTASLPLPIPPSSSIFTHAGICQTHEGRLLVALHDDRGHIGIYSVDPVFTQNESMPTLTAEVIHQNVSATPPYVNLQSESLTGFPEQRLLTHLHFLMESEYSWDHLLNKPHLGPKQPPTLIAVYSSYDNQKDAAGNHFFGTTLIKRWQFRKVQFERHPRFADGGAIAEPQTVPEPMADIILHKTVNNLQAIEPGNVLAITTMDGATSFYHADSFTPILADPKHLTVSNVGQVCLEYPHLTMSPVQCLSPHALVVAYINIEDKILFDNAKVRSTGAYSPHRRQLDPNDPQDDALIASYVLAFSRSCWNSATYDDILSSAQAAIPSSSLIHFRRQVFTTLFQPKTLVPGPGTVSELERIPHLVIVFKALSFHLGLFKLNEANTKHEKIAYLWAWTLLNLRWCIMVLGETYKSMQPQPQPQPNPLAKTQPAAQAIPPPLPPSFLELVHHNIDWIFSLYSCIFGTLLNVSDRVTNPAFFFPPTFAALLGDDLGTGTQGFVALLLTCNWSRSILLIGSRLLNACAVKAHLNVDFSSGKNAVGTIPGHLAGTTLGRVAKTIQSCCSRYGLTTKALEAILDQRFHPDYWQSDYAENRAILERQIEMIVTGELSEPYQGVMQKIVNECINGEQGLRAKGEIDRLRLSDEAPGPSLLFLNMDDMAFKQHNLAFSPDGLIGGGSRAQAGDFMSLETNENSITTSTLASDRKRKRKDLPSRVLYDVHKKLPLFGHESTTINPTPIGSLSLPRIASLETLKKAQLVGKHVHFSEFTLHANVIKTVPGTCPKVTERSILGKGRMKTRGQVEGAHAKSAEIDCAPSLD
ncbi:Mediator of RNA polymerase II transcription subunit 16 [Lithohypha guttulata]|nr:Mediator of RNA polymerase II transcription subunit 16 [Lithohypha guttulata]